MKASRTIRSQRGASLVIALMFLVVLTILGLVAVRSSTVQERMAGNDRDRAIAFEAAEAALRDAERDIQAKHQFRPIRLTPCAPAACACPPRWPRPTGIASRGLARRRAIYGVSSGAGAFPLAVSNPPRYIIELLPDVPAGSGNTLNANARSSTRGGTAYRITARGWGRRPGTTVMLQSVYFKQ